MKLFHAKASPFVRKVMVCAIELGIENQIELSAVSTTPVSPDESLAAANPVKKLPTLITDDGQTLYDSAVITDYLDTVGSKRTAPAEGAERWTEKRRESLADALMDAAILIRYEGAIRPEDKQWSGWTDAQMDKVISALDQMESEAGSLGQEPTLGAISFACALGYLDFRFAELGWRGSRPAIANWYETFSGRSSMQSTVPD